ncbi:MAG: Gfo/Idh/MocA family oxidoreductase [Clostridia bacterium]|nr:Gfo/Idh/MocA family oxidoreductase [Clostridia bacterium]
MQNVTDEGDAMKRIRWCIIGAGGIADRRAIPALLEDDQNEIAAVMDRVPEVAEEVAKKYGVARWFSDEEEMLRAVDCDAVYIATPVFCHKAQALLCLKYDRHVFIEKPLSMTEKEGIEIVDAFKKAGKKMMVGYMMRYHNLHRKAAEIIKDGGIGKINLVRMQFSCWYPEIEGAWRQNKALSGGGCIMDLAVHCMDLFTCLTDDWIDQCHAFYGTKTFQYEVEDSAIISFVSKGGILGHIDVNFNVPDAAIASKVEILGTAGSLVAEGTLGQEERGMLKYIYAPQGDYEAQQSASVANAKEFIGEESNVYLKQFRAFNEMLLSEADYSNAERALKIQALCDQIYQK